MAPFNKDTTYLEALKQVTNRLNKKEQELVVSNRRFRALFDHAPIGILITSKRTILDTNLCLGQMLGYNPCELIGKNTRILYTSDEDYNRVGNLIKEHQEFVTTVPMKSRDGRVKEYTLKVTKISDEENVASIYIEVRGVA
jgi:PAS domain S-box-containing protein